MKLFSVVLLPLMLAGCPQTPIGSIAGGECNLTHTPTYAVKGRTTFDQGWIDDTTEGLVRGCKQPRPQARPASLDVAAPKIAGTVNTPAPPAPAKLHWWQHLRK